MYGCSGGTRLEAFRRALTDPSGSDGPRGARVVQGRLWHDHSSRADQSSWWNPPQATTHWKSFLAASPTVNGLICALYEMWHRQYNYLAPGEGFETHGDSLLMEWTELVRSYLRDLAAVGHCKNADRALKSTSRYDVCHRACMLSQETMATVYHKLMPAATALLIPFTPYDALRCRSS